MKDLVFLLTVIHFSVNAQNFPDPDLQSLIKAEQAFINEAKQGNTRDALLAFLADSAVTFGEHPRKGKKHLGKQVPDQNWLHRETVYTDISSSGDFGFTTGSWELRESREAKEPVGYGRFATVWRKESGAWKVLIDIGISHPKPDAKDSFRTSSRPLKSIPTISKSIMQKVIAEEQKFIRDLETKKSAAYVSYLSDESIIYRHQFQPFHGSEVLPTTARAYKFIDGEIAPSGDLAYVYGKALIESREIGALKKIDANYMRIWKKEDGKNWKIVLDVLTYL